MHRFRDGSQVSSIVCRGDYELSYARNSTHILREGGQLRPGSLVIMAVILSQTTETVACPIPSCMSTEYHTLQSGGLKWLVIVISYMLALILYVARHATLGLTMQPEHLSKKALKTTIILRQISRTSDIAWNIMVSPRKKEAVLKTFETSEYCEYPKNLCLQARASLTSPLPCHTRNRSTSRRHRLECKRSK